MTKQRHENRKILRTRYFVAGVATVLLCVAGSAWADTVSSFAGSCTVDTSNGGTGFWGSATNAQGAADGSYSTVGLPAHNGPTSDYLKCTGFSFNIPGDSVIRGITLVVTRMADADSFTDTEVRVVKGDTVQTAQNKANASAWPLNMVGTEQYGGSGDLWGVPWTVADINDAGFGAALSVTNGGTDPANAAVDSFEITIEFATHAPSPALGTTGVVLTGLGLALAGMLLVRRRALRFV